jgi:capsular exopolysaccharide synthesis family protein
MSKIAKALSRAEEELGISPGDEAWVEQVAPAVQGRASSGQTGPVRGESVADAQAAPAIARDGMRESVEVSYRTTKVAQACFHRMEERRLLSEGAPLALRDAFNILRTQILQQTRASGMNTIMVTSPGRGEGKTTVATNLAISIARDASQTALLVDANLRWPGISCGLGMDTGLGLSDHIMGEIPLGTLFVNPGISKLVVLPAGSTQEDSLDVLSSPKMQRLVAEMKSRYPDRYVIFDCPHLLGMPDALAFAEYVDGIVLVAAEGQTAKTDLQQALTLLQGRNLLGVVMNKIQ